jgi:hypothetical protein
MIIYLYFRRPYRDILWKGEGGSIARAHAKTIAAVEEQVCFRLLLFAFICFRFAFVCLSFAFVCALAFVSLSFRFCLAFVCFRVACVSLSFGFSLLLFLFGFIKFRFGLLSLAYVCFGLLSLAYVCCRLLSFALDCFNLTPVFAFVSPRCGKRWLTARWPPRTARSGCAPLSPSCC